MIKRFLGLCLLLVFSTPALTVEKIVLQLKWEHEFQFAGFYAAQWQGFYRDVGLDVEIRPISRPDGSMVTTVEEVNSGRAHFAVGALDILLAQDKGIDLAVLAPIFQRSASAVFTLSKTPLDDLSQLAKLRIAAVYSDTTKAELEALYRSRGYNVSEINFVDAPPTIQSLIDNKADAIVTYEVSAYFDAREKGVELNKLHPADYGINFYGDTLYTSQKLARERPELVQKFTEASLRGWHYALKHKQELAAQISQELPRYFVKFDNFYGYNLTFSDLIESMLDYPQVELGQNNQERWYSMNERIRSLGLVRSSLSKDEFFFNPEKEQTELPIKVLKFVGVIFLLTLIFTVWYQRKAFLTITGIILMALILEYQIELNLENEQKQSEKLSLYRQLSSVTAKLEGNLQTNMSMLTGFAAYISAAPDLTYENFKNYAREVFKKEPMLINFAAAKDLVINYVYPIEGNEKAIGLDYKKNKAQRDMVMQVAKTGQLLVVGPVNLVQGGVAFIGRAPIYTGDGANRRLWGIISAPLDAQLLYRHSDIELVTNELNLAIKSFDSLGREGPVFFGEGNVFNDPDAIQSVISVGGGTWHLAVTPITHQTTLPTNIKIVRAGSLITVLIFCALVIFRFRQEKEKHALQTTLINNQKLLEKVGSVARIGGWKLDKQLNFVQWSSQTSDLLGQAASFRPKNLDDISDLIEPIGFDSWKSSIELTFQYERTFDIEVKLRSDSEKEVWLRIIANTSEQDVNFVTGTMQDVTDKVLSARYIRHQATYDSLTDLPNRVLFNDRLTQAIENAQRNNNKIAVLFIDLDRFKPVNDNYGHQMGDKLLIEAARRILPCTRDSDTVARLSGDEFGVLLLNINKYDDAIIATEHIIEEMQKTYRIADIDLHCSASIGIAFYPNDSLQADSLIRKADQAMYEVKKNGRNGWQFYTKEMQQQSEHRHSLLNQLILAVKHNELMPYFQPIFNLRTNKITRCETLARWQKKDGTFIPPYEFITLAEESGFVNKIDLSMLQSSATTIKGFIEQDLQKVGLAVNVSPRLFHTKDKALETWLETIKLFSQDIDITVEITERLITDDTKKALSVLKQLKSFGVQIAIDDFGTGYSSLSYLVSFPVDIIKIDQSFVDGIGKEVSAESLIETILIMAKKLNMRVVAEGIETQQQLSFLQTLGCDYGQGFFLAKPMPESDFKQFITRTDYA